MEFTFTETQEEVAALARQVLRQVDEERRRALDARDEHLDRDLWCHLADTGLVGMTAPEAAGGLGLGAFESALVLEAAGEVLARVPLAEAHVAARALRDTDDVELLARVATGGAIVALAIDEAFGSSPRRPAVVATPVTDGWRIDGAKAAVRWAADADVLIVSTRGPERRHLFAVAPTSAGVTLAPATSTTGQPAHLVAFDGVVVGHRAEIGVGDVAVDDLVDGLLVARAATQLGVVSRALALTVDYVSQRHQFGRPIGSFQAVAVRVADASIDTECLRSVVWLAADRLGRGVPSDGASDVAKFWASDAGNRVLAAAIHLHGGIGVTTDYPLHRYYLAARDLELVLGGATVRLDDLGDALVDGRLTPGDVR